MSTMIGALELEGPYFDLDSLNDEPGILAIFSHKDDEFELLELNDADHIREYVSLHPELDRWYQRGLEIAVAIYYTADLSPSVRKAIKMNLDREFILDQAA